MEELYNKPSMVFRKFIVEDIITASIPVVSQNPIADDVTPEDSGLFPDE